MKATTDIKINASELIKKLNLVEYYKGVKIYNVLGRWQVGVKSFEKIGGAKSFIDTFIK